MLLDTSSAHHWVRHVLAHVGLRPRFVAGGATAWGLALALACDGATAPTAVPPSVRPLVVSGAGAYIALAAGEAHACAVRPDGVAECWGANNYGQAPATRAPVSGAFTQVSASFGHTCALRTDGVAECWGYSDGRAPAVRAAASGGAFTQVSAGGSHTCALRADGVVECWGYDDDGRAPPTRAAAAGVFTHVSAGYFHTCAVRTDGVAECWGRDNAGQARTKTAAVGGFTQASSGWYHTCAVRADGVAECWGDDAYGQAPATRGAASGAFTQVGTGVRQTCALRTDGAVECWGEDLLGQAPAVRAAAGGGTYTSLSVGAAHACALRTDGVIECWGDSPDGRAPATRAGGYTDIEAGELHTCGVRPGGVVECWGVNSYGQVPAPRAAAGGGRIFTRVSAGYYHTCALREDGIAECWGYPDGRAPATRAAASGGFAWVSAGGSHTCALRADGVVECWGYNNDGRAPPSRAAATGTFRRLSSGVYHTCALRDDGVVECWGQNNNGQAPATRAAAVGGATFTQVSAGEFHTCALRSDGAVECWGWNDYANAPALRAPSVGGAFVAVGAGARHTCALRADGVAECWGSNANGEAPATRTAMGGAAFVRLTTGGSHNCGLRGDGVAECWGYNGDGRGPATQSPTSVPAHVLPTATLEAPTSVVAGTSFTVSLAGAQVPGHPEATAFTYAFDCGGGSGYGPRTNTPNAICLAGNIVGPQAVRGRVYDQDSDSTQYAATVTVTAPTCRAGPSGVVSLWRADGDAMDLVGSNTSALGNGASFAVGYVGQAFAFDGVDDWAVVGNPANLKLTSALTVEAWIKPTYGAASGQAAYRVIASKWGQSVLRDSYWFALHMSGGTIGLTGVLNQVAAGGGTVYLSADGGSIPSGEWSHVAITFDATTGALRLYANGLQVASASRPGALLTSDANVVIGGEAVGATFRPFPGLIDELTIYSRALSAQEVAGVASTGIGGKCDPPPSPPGPSAQDVTFTTAAPSPAYVGAKYTLGATATSRLSVAFSSLTPATCTVVGNEAAFVMAGLCTIAADQAGDEATWLAAERVTQAVTVERRPQMITWLPAALPSSQYVGTSSVTGADASSSLSVVFSSLTSATCTVAETNQMIVVSYATEGLCMLAADQPGDATYLSAPRLTRTVSIARRPQTVTFTSMPPTPALLDVAYVVSATSSGPLGSSGNPVVLASLTPGVCKVSVGKTSTKVSFQTLGECMVAADQAGDAAYLPAPRQIQSMRVYWPFTGFLPPIATPPTENAVKAGAKVPLSFSLGGDRGLDVSFPNSYFATVYTCGQPDATITSFQAGGTLAYSSTTGNYTFTLHTDKTWAGRCIRWSVTLRDFSRHEVYLTL